MSDELTKEQQDRLKLVQFGIDLEGFLKSQMGLYLVHRAESERKALVEQLVEIDASKPDEVRKIQMKIQVVDSWQRWMAEAILEGRAEESSLVEDAAEAGQTDAG